MTFAIGQTVRLDDELTRDWYETRAADGAGYAPGAQVGRIAEIISDGYCGTCDTGGRDCSGPWYAVDFGDGPASGFGGSYAAHELQPA